MGLKSGEGPGFLWPGAEAPSQEEMVCSAVLLGVGGRLGAGPTGQ